jgi:zinc transport system ATP-binding protein
MEDTPVITVENVSYAYDNLPILSNVDLTVHAHDFLAIVGPNAGGKTTLLKLILGLLKPTSGHIHVFGQDPARARARIGYMPQHASLDPLFPVSVSDVVLMGRLTGGKIGFFNRRDKETAVEALRKVEMHDLSFRPFSALSGGQQQRVLIARALVSNPELLILDEPTSHVDMAVETELYEILSSLNTQMTIVLVSHDLGFVSQYVKNVACVNKLVRVHPTCEISGEMINEIYGTDVHMVRHDATTHRGPNCV